jgi:hypothetical protein
MSTMQAVCSCGHGLTTGRLLARSASSACGPAAASLPPPRRAVPAGRRPLRCAASYSKKSEKKVEAPGAGLPLEGSKPRGDDDTAGGPSGSDAQGEQPTTAASGEASTSSGEQQVRL